MAKLTIQVGDLKLSLQDGNDIVHVKKKKSVFKRPKEGERKTRSSNCKFVDIVAKWYMKDCSSGQKPHYEGSYIPNAGVSDR